MRPRCAIYILIYASSFVGMLAHEGWPDDWEHWRGPNRNDIVAEDSHWEDGAWPPGNAAWSRNVGVGSTSPLVVGRRLYTMGSNGKRDTVFCLDAVAGDDVWRTSYPCPVYGRNAVGDKSLYRGPTSTPEYDAQTGYLYTLSVDGDLNCWDAKRRGRKVWGFNLYDKYKVGQRPQVGKSGRRDYGYTTAPLVFRDWLIVEVGARTGNLMAFSKRTGKQMWASESSDFAGHTGGPALMTVEGIPCVVALTHSNLLVVRLDRGNEGKTLAEYPYATEYANSIASPAVRDNFVLITSGYNHKTMSKIEIRLRGATKVWERKQVSKTCSPIIYNGRVYWAWRQVKCLDFATGEELWHGPAGGDAGSCIITADGRLIVWANVGDLILVETADHSPDRYEELARKRRVFRTQVWPHVVLANGRLYCKDRDGNLKCFLLRPPKRESGRPRGVKRPP